MNKICKSVFELSHTQVKMYDDSGTMHGHEFTSISPTFIWGYNNKVCVGNQHLPMPNQDLLSNFSHRPVYF